ncbi:MAG: hypothetical protein GFH27_549283n414 [Chloroflexi bacterium AL-W]|nr:hypothetical protein [Chloroflexi bacterium AL-N1]NOK64465.1 hypothetical protein [Chloroflexi bacterium AL-N10]NOK75707.1 hypothetical protein [Chloroflexi bacterium AL-N5]NOK80535.1 hypothetical protein [Chloroflexi bacterium AL-W]NOK87049.1 hypothetical protein [Chloroflexi bacterium AL-N15]
MNSSFHRLASVTASTKRPPPMSGGKRSAPVAHLSDIACSPLDPADSETARDLAFRLRRETNAPIDILQTFVDASLDIREGDVLVVEGTGPLPSTEYAIRRANRWTWRNSAYLHLLLEEEQN